MTNFPPNRWLRTDPETRKAEDLHTLRVLAKLVSEDRYRLEALRPERLHKTSITHPHVRVARRGAGLGQGGHGRERSRGAPIAERESVGNQ